MPLQNSAETRNRILEAAAKRFHDAGYKAASVDEICAAARVSKGAFYYHFDSKKALFLSLLEDWVKALDASMSGIRRPTVPETLIRMTNMLPMVFESAQDQLVVWLEFWLEASRDKAIWKATIEPYRHYRELFAGLVKQGIEEGTLKPVDPQAAAQVILSMAVGLFLQGVLDPKGADWPRVAEESMHLMMEGLMTRPAGRRTR